MTILSNTPQTSGVVLATAVLLFAVVSFVVCRGRRIIFCAEQYVMAEKARLLKGHRAVELIMPPPDPSTYKRVGRGVRNFDSAVGDREKKNAVLSGAYAQFTQNPAMKLHLFSTGNKRSAETSPLDPVWGIGQSMWLRRPNSSVAYSFWRATENAHRHLPIPRRHASMRTVGRWRVVG